jgi:hypothetical protein
VVKEYRQPAGNQEVILAALEEKGWPARIDDPLPPARGQDPKVRLRATVKALNGNQLHSLLRRHRPWAGLGRRPDGLTTWRSTGERLDCADVPPTIRQGLRVLAAKDRGRAAVLLVNYGLPASRDVVATVRFAGLTAGRRQLTVWRIDGTRSWSARELRLLPTESREVDVRPEFACQVASPADSVSLVVLEGPR